jgi:hypothetical protein
VRLIPIGRTFVCGWRAAADSGNIAAMRRRMPARALALALAVGLGGVLVALSVAPRVMPGDTFRLKPRAAVSVKVGTPGVVPSPQPGDVSLLLVTELLAIVVSAIVLCVGGRGRARVAPRRHRLAVPRALAAAFCRGPPVSS